jgi:hypothetical protein
VLLGFGKRDIADGREQAPVVEPVDPFERGVLNGFKGSPRSSPVDHLRLVKAIDRLSQGVTGWTPPAPRPSMGELDEQEDRLCKCWRSIWRSSHFTSMV